METETRGDPSPREFYAPWRGTTVNEFENGRISRNRDYFDVAAMIEQIKP